MTLLARAALLTVVALAVAQDLLLVAVLAASGAVACGTPAYPALAAAVPGLAGDRRRQATDLLVTIEVAAFVVGPAIGGLLLEVAPTPVLLPASAAMATLAALPLLHGLVLRRPDATTRPSGSGSLLQVARTSEGVTRAILTVALLNAVLAATGLALLPLAADRWAGGYGTAVAVLGFGALAAPLLSRLGGPAPARTRSGLLLLAAALAVLPLSPRLGWALPALALAGATAVQVEGAVTETLQDAVADRHRAGLLGLTDSVMVAAALAGSLLAPPLVSALGAPGLLALLVAGCLAAAVRPGRLSEPRPAPGPAGPAPGSATGPATGPTTGPGRAPAAPPVRRWARPHGRSWSAAAPRG